MLEHQDLKTQKVRAGFAIATDCRGSHGMDASDSPEVVSTIEFTV
ncbi:hypothetical protein [Laspinema olomoucense]|nr:hypothetical protein [Laspinema sp. D3d]